MQNIKSIRIDSDSSIVDHSHFKEVFDTYYSDLSKFSFLIVKNEDAAEDIVQEFFTSFWINRNKIKITTSMKSYLFSSVKNRSFNYIRDNKKFIKLSETDDMESPENDFEKYDLDNVKNLLSESIQELPEKCRVIFQMKRVKNLSYKEISEKLNISPKTVENQMGIALKKLREKLHPHLKYLLKFFLIYLTKFLGDN